MFSTFRPLIVPFHTAQFVGLAIIVGRDYENSDAYRAAAAPFLVGVHASGIFSAIAFVNISHFRYHVPMTFPTIMDLGVRCTSEALFYVRSHHYRAMPPGGGGRH